MSRLAPCLLAAALLSGCHTDTADLLGKEVSPTGSCEAVATVLTAEDTTSGGYTPASVIGGVGGERAAMLSYDATATLTDLVIEVVPDGEIRWIAETWVPPEGAVDTAADAVIDPCNSRLEIDGSLRFVTADGAFAELFPIVIVGNELGGGRIDQRVEYDALLGSYVPSELDVADWDDVELEWAVNVSPVSTGGEVALFASGRHEGGDTGAGDGFASDMARFEGS